MTQATRINGIQSSLVCFPSYIKRIYTFHSYVLHYSILGSFATAKYFSIVFVYCFCFHKSNFCDWLQACQEHLYCSRHSLNYRNQKQHNRKRNKSQVHTYCTWVWALYHPSQKSEVYYIQGCRAGTFSNSKIRKPNNVKKYNLCHILKCEWHYRMLPICTQILRKCPKICICCLSKWSGCFSDVPLKEQSVNRVFQPVQPNPSVAFCCL